MKAGNDLWHQVFERDRGVCRYCDMDLLQDFEHYQLSSVDHVESQSSGGKIFSKISYFAAMVATHDYLALII